MLYYSAEIYYANVQVHKLWASQINFLLLINVTIIFGLRYSNLLNSARRQQSSLYCTTRRKTSLEYHKKINVKLYFHNNSCFH